MASLGIEELKQEIERIAATYDSNFAGQSRSTRDLDELAGLIKRLQAVLEHLEGLPSTGPGSELARLVEETRARLATYQTEQTAITEAKAAGSEFDEFSRLAAFTNFVFARYFRHFAGKDRGSRDIGLLSEMLEELRTIRQRMTAILKITTSPSFQRDADLVTKMVAMYEEELRQITKAQGSGTADEQAGRLADLANAQIDLYRTHFVGHARLSRRPALLQRIIENLRRIRGSMKSVRASGNVADNNRANITIVENTLRLDEAELAEIRKAKQAAPLSEIMGMLGGAANQVFDEYRQKFAGQDRRSVDLQLLSVLCDKLGEIARQMADLSRSERTDLNERNLEIVMDQLGEYEQEYRAVAKIQLPESGG